jgi:hypothetical protein
MSELEARLNAIGGEPESNPADEIEPVSLMEQFLVDREMERLSSRSSQQNENGDTTETIIEYRRIKLETNQTRSVMHLSFQPDLQSVPTVDANLVDAVGRIRVTHCNTFGARLELSVDPSSLIDSTVCVEATCIANSTII